MTARAKDWTWIQQEVLLTVHSEQLAEHGGLPGVRDANGLSLATARAQNAQRLAHYGTPDAAERAAAYGFGIARNHPFIDGNKRTAFVAVELFLACNGFELTADDADCVLTMLGVAAGDISEADFAIWLRGHIQPA